MEYGVNEVLPVVGHVLWSKQFGECKRFKILPLFWVEVRSDFKFKKSQWCLGYKIFQLGFLGIYYHSPIA